MSPPQLWALHWPSHSQHYNKIRREAKAGIATSDNPATTPTTTPTKAKAKSTPKSTGKKSKAAATNGDDAEDMKPSPSKRKRTSKAAKKDDDLDDLDGQTPAQFKVNETDEDGNIMPQEGDDEEYVCFVLFISHFVFITFVLLIYWMT